MKQHQHPCRECPFSRAIAPGRTGGSHPTVYVGQARGPYLLSCHLSEGYHKDRRSTQHAQCAGAATFRSNIGVGDTIPDALLHLPKDCDRVFASNAELLAHHLKVSIREAEEMLKITTPDDLLKLELSKIGCEFVFLPKKEEKS